VEKQQLPIARDIAAWVREYQGRIEPAWLEHQQMKALEYPAEAEEGQGELKMPDTNSNLVQNTCWTLRSNWCILYKLATKKKKS
jgi:hypothetical protein